jgi:hypothetical protein
MVKRKEDEKQEQEQEHQEQEQETSEQTSRELEALSRIPPATREPMNPFEEFGATSSRGNIAGRLMKFSKGDYFVDDEEIPLGTKFVAVMDELLIGWVKWEDNRPSEQLMGKVAERFVPAPREALGDNDESLWPPDASGRPRDPWQMTFYLVLKDVGKPVENDNLYTLPMNSEGGKDAVKRLCSTYGKAMRQRPDEWPIVEIGVESYVHATWGRIKKPTLKVTEEWERRPLRAAA